MKEGASEQSTQFPGRNIRLQKIRENDYYIDKKRTDQRTVKKRVCRSYTDHPSETLWKNNGDGYACPFFDIRSDNRRLFDGLEIIYDEALCSAWMNLFKELKSGSAGKDSGRTVPAYYEYGIER